MNNKLLTIALSLASTAAMAQAPAFPGAEGHGRYVTGGRGGKIVHVTNLKDSGSGSLRNAVSGSEKKIVVFDVGGVIALNSDLSIGNNTTILGQTAPYPGITLRYYTVRPGGNNIVRFIRLRRGQEKDVNDGADATWQRQETGIILDHCSFSWSIDEVASYYDNNNFTMQWCTVGESLNDAGHGKGAHGYGGIWGGKLASFHHNMIAHVNNRVPRFCGARYEWGGYTANSLYGTYKWANAAQAENVDFRNCLMYNWGTGGCYGGPGGGQINIVNNYYKGGPSTKSPNTITTVSVAANGNSGEGHEHLYGMTSRYYIDGNTTETAEGTVTKNRDWNGVKYDGGIVTINGERCSIDTLNLYGDDVEHLTFAATGNKYVRIKLDTPAPIGEVTTHSAEQAYNKVTAYGGASLFRDDVDARYMAEALGGTATYTGSVTAKAGLIDLVSDAEGYTEDDFPTGKRAAGFDSDNDGMPDAWEEANGLNPKDASDAKTYTLDAKGYYTNLEVYANSLVDDIMKGGNEDALSAVDEYYPETVKAEGVDYYTGKIVERVDPNEKKEDDTPTEDASYLIDQTTYESSPSTTQWNFANGFTVTNSKNKGYATGKESGVKYSAGTTYTIGLPTGFTATSVTFRGYDNYADEDAYLSELAGTKYGSTEYVFPQKDGDTYEVVSHTVTLPSAVTDQLTFTMSGKQCVLSICIDGKAPSTAIHPATAKQGTTATRYYNIKGTRARKPIHGLYIASEVKPDGTTTVRKAVAK